VSGTRCFVAIELSDEIRARLAETRRVLVAGAPAWRGEKWVAAENLHITLKFLGNLEEYQIAEVGEAIAQAVVGAGPFSLTLAGLRAVPNARRCGMVWARFTGDEPACRDLAARIDAAAIACGIEPESRPFKPHVTLVRARRPRHLSDEALSSADTVATDPRLSMSVLSATLVASTLTRTGPVYEAIDSWSLPTPDQRAT